MSINQKAFLFNLIKSMSKAEKRAFKLFIKRSGNAEDMKFTKLFDAVEKQIEYDEEALLKKVPEISKIQLSNLKAHLYRQILTSLRFTIKNRNIDMQIRESLDFARILNNKALYVQALKVLDKAKQVAYEASKINLYLEILEFEKSIESQFITRSPESRAEQLSKEADRAVISVEKVHHFSNLTLRLYGLYIKVGPVKNQEEFNVVKDYFEGLLGNATPDPSAFMENLYYHIAHSWYYYIVQDFKFYYKHTRKWLDLFRSKPKSMIYETNWYIKGLHNHLTACFITLNYKPFMIVLREFEDFVESSWNEFDENLKVNAFFYLNIARLNQGFIEGDFRKGISYESEILKGLDEFDFKIDDHRRLLLYYKLGCLYFGCGDYETALEYLNKVIIFKRTDIREDLQTFSRILSLIIYYETGDLDKLEYQIKSVYHFLGRSNDLNAVQQEIFNFLRRSFKMYPSEVKKEFILLKDRFEELAETPFEKRPFYYLDIISWLKSKIESKTVEGVVFERFNRGYR